MKKRTPDKLLIFIFILLVGFGWLNVFSTVYDGNFTFQSVYGTQLIWIASVVFIGTFTYVLYSRFFYNYVGIIYFVAILLIVFVLFFGVSRSGAKSWLGVGGFGIQPAEFAKYAVCLLLAYFFSQRSFNIRETKNVLIVLVTILLPFGLMLLQNDTGTALPLLFLVIPLFREGLSYWIPLVGICAVVLFIASLFLPQWLLIFLATAILIVWLSMRAKRAKKNRIRMKIAPIFLIYGITVAYLLCVNTVYNKVLRPHQRQRIDLLFGKIDDIKHIGYNVNQAKIAIGSGGLTGKGFGEGTQTHLNFVPEQSTDFIFCTIGEEYGFIGATGVILLFLSLFLRIIFLAERSPNPFVRCYGYSIAAIFFAHYAINIGMTIGLLPVIGIPLPFISYGGSSLWAFTLMLFTFINIEAKLDWKK